MTLFIQIDAGTWGSCGDVVFPASASVDLIQISNNDTGDDVAAGYGEDAFCDGLVKISYERSTTGPCPERLDVLVNTEFGVGDDGIDIIIVAVGSGFTFADGTPMAGNGSSCEPGTSGNPTRSILVFYDVEDNNGEGVCLSAEDNGQYDLSNPTAVLLYHELSHALRQARGELLSLQTADPCSEASPEEQAAMVDENDMRQQMGARRRNTSNHCANPGLDGSCAASCCVVATVATGSPYSAEVNALRRVRDELLRRSEVGFDFFARLHDDYYGFSPQICRLMAGSRVVLEEIRDYFVGPLTTCLELMVAYTLGRSGTEALGGRVLARLRQSPELLRSTPEELDAAEAVLDHPGRAELTGSAELHELAVLIDARARGSEVVHWALFEPIRMIIGTLRLVHANASAAAIGEHLARSFDAWAAQLPLTDVWHGLSRFALAQELAFLGRALVRTSAARAELGARIASHLCNHTDVEALLRIAWDGDEDASP
ncbi:site-specific integrase [Paraliomyxa miuraensis]|uniref:hypothetical protein n=1 Tax=Paraliomyxa miuraensis TaxID=376150 RepID=UPI002251ADEA|nr:hypothetical protein [Paraliomyxa miuraensis]MCX4239960.1 hypothetical protein [Paraliomyxa miuraensis]